ncbi:hypothetical protein D3C78_1876040 [compost metagenome]
MDHRYVDSVHLGALSQRLIAAKGERQALLVGKVLGPPLITGGDRQHPSGTAVLIHVVAETTGYAPRPGDPPAQLLRLSLCLHLAS